MNEMTQRITYMELVHLQSLHRPYGCRSHPPFPSRRSHPCHLPLDRSHSSPVLCRTHLCHLPLDRSHSVPLLCRSHPCHLPLDCSLPCHLGLDRFHLRLGRLREGEQGILLSQLNMKERSSGLYITGALTDVSPSGCGTGAGGGRGGPF